MKNRQTLIAVLLTTVIVGLAYLSFWVGLNEKPDGSVMKPFGNVTANMFVQPVDLVNSAKLSATVAASVEAKPEANRFPYRLTNTKSPIGNLVRNENAVLLRNAF